MLGQDADGGAAERRGPFGGTLAVPVGGFTWDGTLQSMGEPGPFLVPREVAGAARGVRRYAPFAVPGLLDRFVAIDAGDEDAVLRFADEFGALGDGVPVGRLRELPPGEEIVIYGEGVTQGSPRTAAGDSEASWRRHVGEAAMRGRSNAESRRMNRQLSPLLIGESLAAWRLHVAEVRLLRRLWTWAEAADSSALASFLWWERGPDRLVIGGVAVDGEPHARAGVRFQAAIRRGGSFETPDAYVAGSPPTPPDGRSGRYGVPRVVTDADLLGRWGPGDLIEPARWYVTERVGEALRGRVRPRAVPGSATGVVLEVTDLLGAVHALLALDLAGVRSAPGEKPCAWDGCPRAFRPAGRQRFCPDHQVEAALRRKREDWARHSAPRNERRRGTPTTLESTQNRRTGLDRLIAVTETEA